MSHGRVTVIKQKSLFKKLPFWVVVFGFIFAISSLAAQDTENVENSEGAVENEETTTDESKGEEKTKSAESESDDQSASTVANQEEADTKTDKADVKKVKIRIHAPTIAKEEVKKKNPETGSHLPNGDPAANVVRITGNGIVDFYNRIEYLRDRSR